MKNEHFISDGQADRTLFFALCLWAVSSVYGPAAIPFQGLLIIWIIVKCDIKLIPALMILHFTKGNLPILPWPERFLKLGFLLSPGLIFQFGCFFFVLYAFSQNRYDRGTRSGILFWLPALIPGVWISLSAKLNGVDSLWSGPFTDSLVPAGYFWAILVGHSWEHGKDYFLRRMCFLLPTMMILMAIKVFYVWTFSLPPAVICLFFISVKLNRGLGTVLYTGLGSLAALFHLVFSRYFSMAEELGYADRAEMGSTFTRIGVTALAVGLSFALGNKIIRKQAMRWMPYAFLLMTSFVLFYAVTTTGRRGYVEQEYRSFAERFRMKLFNDRATVWKMGLDETFTPPYVFKDLREFIDENAIIGGRDASGRMLRGIGLKVAPHNQVLTLLGRDGWWLGLVLIIWLWWTHIRMVNKATVYGDDPLFMLYFVPVSFALFHVLGLTGQSTCSMNMINHGFEATLVCGIIYSAVTDRQRAEPIFKGGY